MGEDGQLEGRDGGYGAVRPWSTSMRAAAFIASGNEPATEGRGRGGSVREMLGGMTAVTGGKDGHVYVWNAREASAVAALRLFDGAVTAMHALPGYLAVAGKDSETPLQVPNLCDGILTGSVQSCGDVATVGVSSVASTRALTVIRPRAAGRGPRAAGHGCT